MPRVTSRDKREAELASIIQTATDKQKAAIIRSMGSPPQITGETTRLVNEISDEIKGNEEAVALLLLLFIGGIDGMRRQRNLPAIDFSAEQAANEAQRFASGRITDIADRMSTNTLDKLGKAAIRSRENQTPLEVETEKTLGEDRAKGIGKGEVSGANTAGENSFRDEHKKQHPDVNIVAVWKHSGIRPPDHAGAIIRPCKICTPLLNTTEDKWPIIHPDKPWLWDGPQAHDNCDCFMDMVPVTAAGERLPAVQTEIISGIRRGVF